MALLDMRQIPDAKAARLTVQVNRKNVIPDVYLNQDRDTIGNLKARQAFMLALDRAARADVLGGGVSQRTRGCSVPHRRCTTTRLKPFTCLTRSRPAGSTRRSVRGDPVPPAYQCLRS